MEKGCHKIRMSYDELAYILSLFDVDTYVFFENQGRNIDVEKAVPLINDIIRKKWLIPGNNRYMISREIRQCVDHIKDHTCLFAVKTDHNHCPDLLCYSQKDSILSLEKDYNREEYILLSLNNVDSFVEMLEEEGYLMSIVPVNEEDRNDAENSLSEYGNAPDLSNTLAGKEAKNPILSFECISEREQTEGDSFGWIPEDPFVEEGDGVPMTHNPSIIGVYVYGKELYPYIAVKKNKYTVRIPYNKKNLVRILSDHIMGEL